ncbi:MAG: SUMF1/EgtB/PvdO family nonheme iron enzyme [Deltaproteobacteria bacterium]|nr:SUMF1/EgtB/PvdO family nonheme iron enzyme [Deltaproteobacteria bacterium]
MFEKKLDMLCARHGLGAEAREELLELLRTAGSAMEPGVTLVPGDPHALESATHPSRYLELGLIGRGGMGEVRQVRDLELNRVVAMKILRRELENHHPTVSRFVEEAQATAQLEHPGIVPVHELGRLPDGRLYFTMKKVRGRTLADVIQEVHQASSGADWARGPSGWSFRRLLDAFRRVCEAVAYAHALGVVHRDLKPANVMVGEYGEVLVLDWGLAKVLGRQALDLDGAVEVDGLGLETDDPDDLRTKMGSVFGTPAYMSPEQGRGDVHRIGPTSDVYSLGAILYEILSGKRPYGQETSKRILQKLLAGPPASIEVHHPVPDVLIHICGRAMARDPTDRFPEASLVAGEVGSWLEGTRRRERALDAIDQADGLAPQIAELRQRAEVLRQRAADLLEPLPPAAPVVRKRAGWALDDQAIRMERAADLVDVTRNEFLYAALTHAPDLVEAHARLAQHFQGLHAQAEGVREEAATARLEAVLRTHVEKLEELDPEASEVARLRAYLEGQGALSLVTDPPGAKVDLHRFFTRDRHLVTERVGGLGRTPVSEVPLPAGSYLLRVRAAGRNEISYPVRIEREKHWDGVPPGGSAPLPVYLPRVGELGPGDRYVPPGWYWSGGDPRASGALSRRRVWIDGFVMRAHPVTNAEYLAFLEALVRDDRVEEALSHAPRAEDMVGDEADLLFAWLGDRFTLDPEDTGRMLLQDQPVVGVDWHGAQAWADWHARLSGFAWRLPSELEWEKAARGMDGRFFPWGDFLDPTFCSMRDSHPGSSGCASVDSFPVDESPYGVRGLAGNVFEWTSDPYLPEGPEVIGGRPEGGQSGARVPRVARGGGWRSPARFVRVSSRVRNDPRLRALDLGFRVVRSLDGEAVDGSTTSRG